MMTAFRDLIEFERACGHELSEAGPGFPEPDVVALRKRLITEEVGETLAAIEAGDLEGVADGIADAIYVLLGTAVQFGIDIVPIWSATQKANLAKFGPGSYFREDGKLMKPEGWKHADVAGILHAQKPLAEIYGTAKVKDLPADATWGRHWTEEDWARDYADETPSGDTK